MYPSVRDPRLAGSRPGRDARWRRVGGNVLFLGLTSLFTDVSSEMVTAILPIYLTFELRFSPLQFGIFDGLYQGVTAVLRLAGGVLADRRQRPKSVAAVGYTLSAVCKLGLLAASGAWLVSTAILFLDRLGKGIRTAPRDALISLSAERGRLAEAFGVHRALDTAGACLGPVLAFSLLYLAPGAFDAVFVVSFCAALVGLAVLFLFVDDRVGASGRPEGSEPASLRAALGLLGTRRFRTLTLLGTVLSLATISDAFVYLVFQRRSDIDLAFFPLLYVGTALVYLVLSVPVGRLADRVGAARVFVAGYVALLALYAVLLLPTSGPAAVVAGILLFGGYYAANDGVLMALASETLPAHLRTTGLALLTTTVAIARLVSAVLFGALWSWYGSGWTVGVYAAALLVAIPMAAVRLRSGPPVMEAA